MNAKEWEATIPERERIGAWKEVLSCLAACEKDRDDLKALLAQCEDVLKYHLCCQVATSTEAKVLSAIRAAREEV